MKKEMLKIEAIPSYICITSKMPKFATKEGLQISVMRSGSVKIYFGRRDGTKHTAMVSNAKHYKEEIQRFVQMVNYDIEK